ncbi:MAG: 50S ribosomal protein L7/L12 [Parcubacteria group bacterium CG11_big_fil_rev_8_21_14_0_20_39_22]|nr:MAG: 50S ribosomal protein L7/L12 [Parcubacteria group bacterium CG11_big_fil_rev_8_21_14_0_20_39_22]
MTDETQNTQGDVKEEASAPEAKAEEAKSDDAQSSGEAKPADAKEEEGENVEVPEKFKTIVESIENMSVLDLNELVKLLEKKFGVSAAAVAVAAPGAGDGAGAGEEKSSFDVELSDAGAQKIAVIKVVKEVLGLGLKEAKDLVDAAPSELKKGMKKEEAEEFKTKLEGAGGKVTLK